MKKRHFLSAMIVVFFISISAFSSKPAKIDSLKSLLPQTIGKEQAEILIELSKSYKNFFPDTALMYAFRAKEVSLDYNSDEWLSESLYRIAMCYDKKKQYDSCILFAQKSLEIEEATGNRENLASRLARIGIQHFKMFNYDKAIEYLSQAVDLAAEFGEEKSECFYSVYLGSAYSSIADFENAIIYFTRALRINDKLGLESSKADNLTQIAVVYFEIGNKKKALEYFLASLKIREKLSQFLGMAGSYNNIGLMYYKDEEYENALEYFNKALEINEREGFVSYKSKNLLNIGNVYVQQGNYIKALELYRQTLKIKKELKSRGGIAECNLNIGTVYQRLGQNDLAIQYYLEALNISEGHSLSVITRKVYLGLSEVYEDLGNFEDALVMRKKYVHIKDSLLSNEKIKAITEIYTKYETDKKDRENQQLRDEARNRKRIQVILIIFGATLLAILILLFFLLRMKSRSLGKSKQLNEQDKLLKNLAAQNTERENQRLEELVFAEHKINELQKEKLSLLNRQMSLVAMQMLSKTELLLDIKKKLAQKADDSENQEESLREILQLIENNESFDRDWDHFKKHFEEVNQGFFEKVQQLKAGITSNDLKICAYIKIGLTTKEIARILNVTVAAVNKSRQRLKKKLGLSESQDLSTFIIEL